MRKGRGKQGSDLMFQHYREQQADPVTTLAPVAATSTNLLPAPQSVAVSERLRLSMTVTPSWEKFMKIHYRIFCTVVSVGRSHDPSVLSHNLPFSPD